MNGAQNHSITTIYGYDSMNRLVAENCGDSRISYKYDLSGNRISRVTDGRTENYLYNSRNQLTELTGENKHIRYTYDPAGNLVEEQTESNKKIYAYDAYNRNTEITGKEFTQKNHYDAEGYRYSIEENDKVTNFVYRGGIMLAELDEAKNPTKSYVPGNEYAGQSAVNPLNNSLTSKNKATFYYITDEQGSIRYILDQSGEVKNYYQYSAFGETATAEESIPNRLRYNAQTEDELTGLYYLRARYYAPNIGRFTQEDVIYNDGLNLYAYCDSNPVMYCDPSGFAKTSGCEPKVGGECGSSSGNEVVRGMTENSEGMPQIGDSARTLGARKGVDIPVDNNGIVYPNTGGMSVSPNVDGLPSHRKPPEYGGTGKDPVWKMNTGDLGDDLVYIPDSPTHGTIQPSRPMTFDEYQDALAKTLKDWSKK